MAVQRLAAPSARQLTAELVALCERPVEPQGPELGISYFSDEDYRRRAGELIQRAEGELHVFAYGSLLWRPAFEPARSMPAEAPGWRREFCMEITRWRACPAQPGLMMALRRGGQCRGLVMQLTPRAAEDQLVMLLKREVDTEEDMQSLHWITVVTEQGRLPALAFWAEPVSSRMFVERPLDEQAHMLARACGTTGSGAAYLWKTVESLRAHGIEDQYLENLADRVATVICKDAGHNVSLVLA
jgi:cation transport protein ChaC